MKRADLRKASRLLKSSTHFFLNHSNLKSYLNEYFGHHLANVLSPLWDVWIELVQVPAEAQRDNLKVIWDQTEQGSPIKLAIITVVIQKLKMNY